MALLMPDRDMSFMVRCRRAQREEQGEPFLAAPSENETPNRYIEMSYSPLMRDRLSWSELHKVVNRRILTDDLDRPLRYCVGEKFKNSPRGIVTEDNESLVSSLSLRNGILYRPNVFDPDVREYWYNLPERVDDLLGTFTEMERLAKEVEKAVKEYSTNSATRIKDVVFEYKDDEMNGGSVPIFFRVGGQVFRARPDLDVIYGGPRGSNDDKFPETPAGNINLAMAMFYWGVWDYEVAKSRAQLHCTLDMPLLHRMTFVYKDTVIETEAGGISQFVDAVLEYSPITDRADVAVRPAGRRW